MTKAQAKRQRETDRQLRFGRETGLNAIGAWPEYTAWKKQAVRRPSDRLLNRPEGWWKKPQRKKR